MSRRLDQSMQSHSFILCILFLFSIDVHIFRKEMILQAVLKTFVFSHTHTHQYSRTHGYAYMYKYLCMYLHMHTHKHAPQYIYVCVCVCVCVCIKTHVFIWYKNLLGVTRARRLQEDTFSCHDVWLWYL